MNEICPVGLNFGENCSKSYIKPNLPFHKKRVTDDAGRILIWKENLKILLYQLPRVHDWCFRRLTN